MEVVAHEFSPALHDQNDCEQCSYHEGHPVHTLWVVDRKAFVEVGPKFVTKDSGKREEFDSGMVRDTQDDKPRYDLLIHLDVGYADQFLTRMAELSTRGALKYGERNADKATGPEEMTRFQSSAFRHFMQWLCGEEDEDHAAAAAWNILMFENAKRRNNNAS